MIELCFPTLLEKWQKVYANKAQRRLKKKDNKTIAQFMYVGDVYYLPISY